VTAPLRKILVPIDGSESSSRALEFAVERAQVAGAEIAVVLVVNELAAALTTAIPYEYADAAPLLATLDSDAESILGTAEAFVRKAGLTVKCIRLDGLPGTEILSLARESETDLIVMGSRGRSSLSLVALGSVADEVVRSAPAPVFVISDRSKRASNAGGLRHALVAVDVSPAAGLALQFACEIARIEKARLTFCTVTGNADKAKASLDSAVAVAASSGVPADTVTRSGDVAGEILSAAASVGADVIVMGTHGRSGIAEFVLGSVAQAVLAMAHVPVCTVRSAGA
jgi:nucleotide-binding universal stress UspA family protein